MARAARRQRSRAPDPTGTPTRLVGLAIASMLPVAVVFIVSPFLGRNFVRAFPLTAAGLLAISFGLSTWALVYRRRLPRNVKGGKGVRTGTLLAATSLGLSASGILSWIVTT